MQKNEKIIEKLLLIILLIGFISHCSPQVSQTSTQRSKVKIPSIEQEGYKDKFSHNQSELSEGTSDFAGNGASTNEDENDINIMNNYTDPRTIHAKVEPKVELQLSDLSKSEDYKSPFIKIEMGNSDYVQVARCSASFQLLTDTGEKFEDVQNRYDVYDMNRYTWKTILANYRSCVLIGEGIGSNSYLDTAAKSGKYYYIINPCIFKNRSLNRNDSCSYKLSKTDSFEYENKYLEDVLAKSIELSKATAELNYLVTEVSYWAKLFELRLRACEDKIAHDNAIRGFYRGMIALGIFLVINTIGLSLGLPMATAMLSIMAMQMGTMIIAKYAGIKDKVNTCLSGLDTMDRKSATENKVDYNQFKKDAKKIESRFGVVAALAQIEELTKQDGSRTDQHPAHEPLPGDGLIFKARAKMLKIQEEMRSLDSRIMSMDSQIAKLNKEGLDPNHPEKMVDTIIARSGNDMVGSEAQ